MQRARSQISFLLDSALPTCLYHQLSIGVLANKNLSRSGVMGFESRSVTSHEDVHPKQSRMDDVRRINGFISHDNIEVYLYLIEAPEAPERVLYRARTLLMQRRYVSPSAAALQLVL